VHQSSEAELIRRAQACDAKAISQLYHEHVQAIYRYVYLRVSDTHTAEDITSDVFVHALEGLPDFEYRGIPFSAWLYRIARDRVVDHYRKQARRGQPVELSEGLVSETAEPHDAVIQSMEEQEIRQALDELTEDQRLVVVLRFMEHKSLGEVACQLGKTEGAIKSLQHRALSALSRVMEEKKV
jgi:RNA polymerase sigma-70 factor, ECF subfamily